MHRIFRCDAGYSRIESPEHLAELIDVCSTLVENEERSVIYTARQFVDGCDHQAGKTDTALLFCCAAQLLLWAVDDLAARVERGELQAADLRLPLSKEMLAAQQHFVAKGAHTTITIHEKED